MIPGTGELVIDLFAGGGGASRGIEMAGLTVDYAINHDPAAVAMHKANHPDTVHLCQDVWEVEPLSVSKGRPVGLIWASPDCTHHSVAKGSAPYRDKQKRELANVIIDKWIPELKPRVVILENVREFSEWGPLDDEGRLINVFKGYEFSRFLHKFKAAGYRVEWRILSACDYGAPTIRKRLFLIARNDGLPIVWPRPTNGVGLKPYRTAAEIIDFSLPCPSIFLSTEEAKKIGCRRPLSDTTLKRIAHGIVKYVINTDKPYIVDNTAYGLTVTGYGDLNKGVGKPSHIADMRKPLNTVVAGGIKHGVFACILTHLANKGNIRTPDINKPLNTILAGGQQHGLATVFLEKHIGSAAEHRVYAFLTKYYGMCVGESLNDPIGTVMAWAGHYGLVTVSIDGERYAITNIGLRMLSIAELFRAQGFEKYIYDIEVNGKRLSKGTQNHLVGNSVVPQCAAAVVKANIQHIAGYGLESEYNMAAIDLL
jgi:DNA (cytosine-5)-methyltransferase 1